MGVPSLYRWLTQRYPEIKMKPDTEADTTIDNLYLDFNAVVHPCCNKSLENMADTDSELYKNLESFLDEIVGIIRPKRLLYIAIDGVAPRAKLNQQRSRRFVHAKEALEKGNRYFKDDCGTEPLIRCDKRDGEEEPEQGVFDTNAITPGTKFMQRLDRFLQELIAYKMSNDSKWGAFNVIYSNYKIPGEGEQKIMEYIRKHQNKNHKMVIFSPDADLIFLGVTLFDYSVMILREEPPRPGQEPRNDKKRDLSLVDIPKLRNLLIREFQGVMRIPLNPRRFLEDWVLLCFTVGNDFLPCTPCFEIRTDALEKLTSILQSVYSRTRSYITDNGKINYDVLREFFIECSRRENTYIIEKRSNLIQSRNRMSLPYNPSDEFYLENENGKIKYYIEKMNINSEEEVTKACEEYIKGLEWVYNYYFYDIKSWEWFYPYHFAPFMSDLARIRKPKVDFKMGRPLKPFEQLLAVLPPLSKDLLPECLHPVFEKLSEYYPVDFKLDMFQKCMDWQAVPILPFINTQKIVDEFESRQSELTFEEAERNMIGYPLFYSKQTNLVSKICSLYKELKMRDFVKLDEFVGKISVSNKFVEIDSKVESCGFSYINKVVWFNFDQRKSK